MKHYLSPLLVSLVWMFVPAFTPVTTFAQHEPFVAVRTARAGGVQGYFNGVCVGQRDGGSLVLTVSHGVQNIQKLEVSYQGTALPASVLQDVPQYDLAVVLVPGVVMPVCLVAQAAPPEGALITLHVYDHQQEARWTPLGGLFRRGNSNLINAGKQVPAWQFRRPVKQGFSGGAFTYQGQLIGIQLAGDQEYGLMATLDQIREVLRSVQPTLGVPYVRPQQQISPLDPNVLYVVTQPACLPCEQFKADSYLFSSSGLQIEYLELTDPRLTGQQVSQVPTFLYGGKVVVGYSGIQALVSGLGLRVSVVEKPLPPKPQAPNSSPQTAEDLNKGPASKPETLTPIKNWAWDGLSAWGWAAIGGAVAGPVGIAIPVLGRMIHRRLKSTAAPQTPHPQTPAPNWQGNQQIPPPRSTDVGRERIVERVVNLADDQRRAYEQRIADLEQSQTVNYPAIESDHGLVRMRQAMKLTADQYPSARRWVKTIEDVFTTLLSGDKSHV